MALTVAAVDQYTKGRLAQADPETAEILKRALAAVRAYCEWHVSPVIANDVVVLDGPGGRLVSLPTGKLGTLHSVIEDGVSLDVSDLTYSMTKPVLLCKRSRGCWSREFSGIQVTMTHGYTDEEAADFEHCVLDACDRFAQMVGTQNVNGLKRYDVDDIKREWFDPRTIQDRAEDVFNTRLVARHRLMEPL